MNALTISASRLPDSTPPKLVTLVGTYANGLEAIPGPGSREAICASSAPGEAERAVMVFERRRLNAMLEPASAEHARAVIALLLTGWPAYGDSEDDTETLVKMIAKAVRTDPAWAIEEAARRFRDDEVSFAWSPRQAPTPPAFARECGIITRAYVADLAKLSRVLDAEVLPEPDPEAVEQARQAARDAVAGKLFREQQDQRRAVEAEEAERDVVLAGPPIKAGALGAMALGNALSTRRFRQPVA